MLAGMTESVSFPSTVGARAARVLVHELLRRPGGKVGLLVGGAPGSPVLSAAIDALLPDDSLVVATPHPEPTRAHVARLGRWVADRVRVVDDPAAAGPADVLVLAEPLRGSAEEARSTLDTYAKHLATGGVLTAATVRPCRAVSPGAAAELERQAALYGVGSDLVLRNLPPVRVHRLRFTPADPALADRLTGVPALQRAADPRPCTSTPTAWPPPGSRWAWPRWPGRPGRSRKLWLVPALAAAPVAAFFRDPRAGDPGRPDRGGGGQRRQGAVGGADAPTSGSATDGSTCGSRSSCRCSTCTSTGRRWPAGWSTTSSTTAGTPRR